LHICYICCEYPPAPHGGIGSFTQVLARALVKRGHRVTVLGMYPDQYAGTDIDQGVNIIRVSRRGFPMLRFFTNRSKFGEALLKLNAVHPVDIVEGGEMDIALLSSSTPGISVLRMHGGPTFFGAGGRIQRWKEKWAFHIADELCAVSHCVADGTRRMLRLGTRHVEVIHNPIETRLFAPPLDDLTEQEGLVVFAGTISERKGIRQLIHAMPRIVAAVPDARLEVFGGEEIDPPPKVSLKADLIRWMPPEVASHVEWKGRVARSELPLAIRRASVCVYPSHIEAMPIAWLEGLAAGKAVVASRTGPGPEIIDDGTTGLLCDPNDPNSIAEAVIRLLKDPAFRRQLGLTARRIVQERYELDAIVDQNEMYYRKLMEQPG
jgi:glycosyltransferase involved in cell wall biosynthesis